MLVEGWPLFVVVSVVDFNVGDSKNERWGEAGEKKSKTKGGSHTKSPTKSKRPDHAAVVAFIRVRRGSGDDYDRPSSYRRLSL